jgi:hypothetical protein
VYGVAMILIWADRHCCRFYILEKLMVEKAEKNELLSVR